MKILLTTFEVFNGFKTNSSNLVLEKINNDNIIKLVLPVSYAKARKILIDKINEEKPDYVLSLGLAAGTNLIRVEKIGINFQGAKIADNDGILITDKKISDGADGIITKVNTEKIINLLNDNDIPNTLSLSAGGFICNTVYYTCLEYNKGKALFLHLPHTTIEDEKGLDLDILVKGVSLVIDYIKSL